MSRKITTLEEVAEARQFIDTRVRTGLWSNERGIKQHTILDGIEHDIIHPVDPQPYP